MKLYVMLQNMSITKERQGKSLSPSLQHASAVQPRATERGLRLLSIVADNPSGVALADAARSTELSPSTALRQLRSLETVGFATHLPDGRWAPGDELFRIARALTLIDSLARLAQPLLVTLAEQTGESAYLAEPLDALTATYVAMEPSRHAIRHVSWLGRSLNRKSTAAGAALKGRVDTDGTVVRDDAVEVGITAISAPVRDGSGAIIAAVSAVGPTYRLQSFGLPAARRLVAECANTLSNRLTGVAQ
jgi:IclR family transcriptional regulator, acetate operon repressor